MVRKKITADELSARAKANGYQRGAHRDKDSLRDQNKHVDKVKKDQDAALHRYVLWHHEEMKEDALQKGLPVPDEAAVQDQVLKKHVDAADLATVKDFLRFHAATSKGKIREKISCDSLNTFAEWFFAGFSRVTDTPINDNDRSEVYNWVRRPDEGLVVNIRRPKHLFTERDLNRLLRTPWTEDDPIFMSGSS